MPTAKARISRGHERSSDSFLLKVVLPTIPHTGTRTAKGMLRRAGVDVRQIHTYSEHLPLFFDLIESREIFVFTTRPERDTRASWIRRNKVSGGWRNYEEIRRNERYLRILCAQLGVEHYVLELGGSLLEIERGLKIKLGPWTWEGRFGT